MDIFGLMDLTSEENRLILNELIGLKATVGEKYLHRTENHLIRLAQGLFDFIGPAKNNLAANKNDNEKLNRFFITTLDANTHH